ncbi:MAG: allantoate amidohydrolase [Acidobacteriaceae bacterium]
MTAPTAQAPPAHTAGVAHEDRAQRIIARCRELARCTEVPGETTRTFLAPSMHRVHALAGGWMRAAGMASYIDAAGNLRGVLAAANPRAPRLLIGSHLDTVANAGAYDGILGVVMGVALVEAIVDEARAASSPAPLPFTIEVIGFSEEEGVRFSKPFLGSLAVIGQLDSTTLALTDRDGVTIADAIRKFGLDPGELADAVVDPTAFGYVEFHIEQGPVLESENAALAVVEAIAGQTRMGLLFTGQANHAGTTPMGPLRRDALAAAAEWIVEVERYANATPGLVATVGKVESSSGAGNVIAGRFTATLDVRHANDDIRHAAVDHFLDYAREAGAKRGVGVAHSTSIDQPAVPMGSELSALLGAAVARSTGREPRLMTSGAGHDAMIVARRVPAAILFLRSPGGLSHHPDESVASADVAAALAAGVEFLRALRDDRAMLERIAVPASHPREDLNA